VATPRGAAQKLLLEQAAQQRQESAADSVLQRAVALERGGRIDEAVDLLTRSIGTLKNPAPLYNRLGLILLDQHHDYDRASTLLRKATELEPENSVYMMNLYAVLSMKAEATDPGRKRKPRGK
jgi:type IV pilus assembly protein PilB